MSGRYSSLLQEEQDNYNTTIFLINSYVSSFIFSKIYPTVLVIIVLVFPCKKFSNSAKILKQIANIFIY